MMHMTIKAPDLSKFRWDKETFFGDSLDIIVDDIVEGIARRKAVTGGDLPPLERSTKLRKLHDHQLVDKGLLIDKYTYEQKNQWRQDHGTVSIKPLSIAGDKARNKVGYALQIDGVRYGPGKQLIKKFFFFGISKDAEAKIMELLGTIIESAMEAL